MALKWERAGETQDFGSMILDWHALARVFGTFERGVRLRSGENRGLLTFTESE
jgi:hypothetical protein